MFLSYYCVSIFGKGSLPAHNDKCFSLVKFLYIYIFAILSCLTTINQCLTTFFSRKYVSVERSPLDEAKKASNYWKSWNVKNASG